MSLRALVASNLTLGLGARSRFVNKGIAGLASGPNWASAMMDSASMRTSVSVRESLRDFVNAARPIPARHGSGPMTGRSTGETQDLDSYSPDPATGKEPPTLPPDQ